MIEERKKLPEDPELESIAAVYKMVNSRVEDLVEAGVQGSRKSYFLGRLEVYSRMLANLSRVEEGLDSFFMGSLWHDIRHSSLLSAEEELIEKSLSGEDAHKPQQDPLQEIENKYSLNFLKKRARAETEETEDSKKIEMIPGGVLKPLKKTP